MGNGGLYSFAYIYLTGNPVVGEALICRGLLALTGYVLCGAILYAKHRHQHQEIRFHHVVRKFDLSKPVYLWQLRMALSVSLVMTAGQVFGVERFMWMGFACASLLSEYPYSANTFPRFWQRIVGAVAGSCLFFVLYSPLPESLHSLLGPLGGLCLGFCTDYRYKTSMNCLGALMLGAGIYGLQGAVVLRIADTIIGVAFGLVFTMIFHLLVASRFLSKPQTKCPQFIKKRGFPQTYTFTFSAPDLHKTKIPPDFSDWEMSGEIFYYGRFWALCLGGFLIAVCPVPIPPPKCPHSADRSC